MTDLSKLAVIAIGVAEYPESSGLQLKYPAKHAVGLVRQLVNAGLPPQNAFLFISNPQSVTDLVGARINDAEGRTIEQFLLHWKDGQKFDRLLFLWGGHGAEVSGETRLLTDDASTTDAFRYIAAKGILTRLRSRRFPKDQIVIFDVCRTPLGSSAGYDWSAAGDLGNPPTQRNLRQIYAGTTRLGEAALDAGFSDELLKDGITTESWEPDWRFYWGERAVTIGKRIGQVIRFWDAEDPGAKDPDHPGFWPSDNPSSDLRPVVYIAYEGPSKTTVKIKSNLYGQLTMMPAYREGKFEVFCHREFPVGEDKRDYTRRMVERTAIAIIIEEPQLFLEPLFIDLVQQQLLDRSELGKSKIIRFGRGLVAEGVLGDYARFEEIHPGGLAMKKIIDWAGKSLSSGLK